MDTFAAITVYAYFGILAILSIYGIHRYFILYLYLRHYKFGKPREVPVLARDEYPTVTIQLPLYNEYYVARRVIEAAAAIRYPRHLLRIQVLDDSTDDTTTVARETVDELCAKGINAEYHHREIRDGYKAGALRDGLA
ncbi:MAG: glycosyltransferase, partial [Candidatus Krumholzibacteriota bacterium]|nr:glycosyltransferase [Candidatus Krumholzibacteriota bacterium]